MRLICLYFLLVILCFSTADITSLYQEKGSKVVKYADGVEFDSVSRGTLLHILTTFEQHLLTRLAGGNVKPVFTAEFANNKYTRPFIYPKDQRYGVRMQPELSSNYPDPRFLSKTSLIQMGYGVWVNLSMVVIGLALGFTAIALPQLTDSNIKPAVSDQSWIASVLTLAAPLGNIICGYLIDRIGRRLMLIFSHLPVVIGWFYTGVSASVRDLIIGRAITGFGIGMVMSVPRPYLTEISLPNMRGVVGSFPNLAMSIGITAQAGLGSIFRWHTICFICTFYSLALMVFNYFLPETPYYLLMNDSIENAEAALRKFRSSKHNINAEMDELLDFKMDNDIHGLTWKEKFSALFKRSACKPFCLITVYLTIAQLSGIYVMVMWTVQILERSKSSVDPNTGNILLGVTRLLAGVLTSILIFKLGRRSLALTSGVGVGTACVFVGLFINYTEELTVIPQICYMAYTVFATLGHYTLPVLIMSELYPLQVRGILGGISTSIINFSVFGMNKLYPHLNNILGFANTIISFGIVSLLGSIYLYFYLPETKDLTLQEIEEYYNDRRPTLTSQRRIRSMHQLSKHVLTRSDTASRSLIRILDKRKGKGDKTKASGSKATKDDDVTNPPDTNKNG